MTVKSIAVSSENDNKYRLEIVYIAQTEPPDR